MSEQKNQDEIIVEIRVSPCLSFEMTEGKQLIIKVKSNSLLSIQEEGKERGIFEYVNSFIGFDENGQLKGKSS
jgi:hypothetical protein